MNLEFLNQNLYRRYPLRSDSNLLTEEGVQIPTGLLTSISMSVTSAYNPVHISKIYCKDSYINITVSSGSTALGVFSGEISKDYQQLLFTAFISEVSGLLTVGSIEIIKQFTGSHTVSSTNGRIEDSLVLVFTAPTVTKLISKDDVGVGNISITTTNITVTDPIHLVVTDESLVLSNNDPSGEFGNCGTPTITHINSVPASISGNIDIFVVNPLVLNLSTGTLEIAHSTLDVYSACKAKSPLLPPVDNLSNDYYDDITTVNLPEWKGWSI